MSSFSHAVAVPPRDPGWRHQVSERLTGLREAFAAHVGATEGPDGLYGKLVDEAPRLAPGVHGLVRDHRSLLDSMEGLERRFCPKKPADAGRSRPERSAAAIADPVADTASDPDVDQLRGWARQLIQELYEHRQRGADLLYEAYGTDIGGET